MNRYYTTKIEQLERQQKSKIEKLESSQGRDQRDMVSQLKKEQQRELDAFNQNMKQEQSELKKQVAAQFNDRKSRQTTLKNRNDGVDYVFSHLIHANTIHHNIPHNQRKTQLDQHQKYKESAFRY